MSSGDRCPVVHFNHNSQAHADDPVGSYRALRAATPVAWSEENGGFWVLSDYASVFEAARNDELFSSARTPSGGDGLAVVIPKTPMHFHIPIELDPPESRKYRKLINLITAPAATDKMHDMIVYYSTLFIDEYIEQGACDFGDVIGVPSAVTIDWLGLPVDEWKRYGAAHRATLAASPESEEFRRAVEVDLPYLSDQVREVITARRAEPKDDAISFLVTQEVDGKPLTDFESFSIIELLIAGGTGTTASLVGSSLVWLHQHPDVRQRLIDDPSLLEHAIEEFLRCFAPTQSLARTVTEDTEFHGCALHAGDRALLAWASANRDDGVFDHPDEVDIERWPNRHQSFGVGIHRCAGSHLGRAIARELLGQVLERTPDYVIDESSLERYPHQGTNVGFRKIPATFTPGSRRLPVGG